MEKDIPNHKHFSSVSLAESANASVDSLPGSFDLRNTYQPLKGQISCRGIPFDCGEDESANLILLDKETVEVAINKDQVTYIIFLHAVENTPAIYQKGLADDKSEYGAHSGEHVSNYIIEYDNGETASHPIHRRFATQQNKISWGSSAFAATPYHKDLAFRSTNEDVALGVVPTKGTGRSEIRAASGRDLPSSRLWLYALPNPHPERSIRSIRLEPCDERAIVCGIALTALKEHPLRYEARKKLLLTLPEGVAFNDIGELDDIQIDLGNVISARQQLLYPSQDWKDTAIEVQPTPSENTAVIEYTAHPEAWLYLKDKAGGAHAYKLSDMAFTEGIDSINTANRPVRIRVIDSKTRQEVCARLHLHGETGEYLPPKGFHRKVNKEWFEDWYAEFANKLNQYCYIDGNCVADLPLGKVYVEINRGYEITPIRVCVEIKADTDELVFELDRALDWRSRGWVTADTHVHFLSPSTAEREGSAEDINVVNLLASQWGELFTNVGDFDGKSTQGSIESGKSGEFLVRVGSENRMQVLGHISLLGYEGPMIMPLCTGGPTESALGDAQEVTMAEWARQCIKQKGLVVLPHAPNPQCERAADVVLEVVHAIEMMAFNPHKTGQLSAYGLAEWYRYLNVGYHLPIVGGTDKMSASMLLGGMRTYAHMGDRDFNYENWMEAVKAGNTFATVGPLVEMHVEGQAPGSRIDLPKSGGTLNVAWKVESAQLPIDAVEVVVGGETFEECRFKGVLEASGSAEVPVAQSTWIALRVRGSYQHGIAGEDIAAHSSAVMILVDQASLFSKPDAMTMLREIEGSMAYIDTIATRGAADQYRKLRMDMESAHRKLHQRMHQLGMYHEHTPIHDHEEHHEH